MGKYIFHEFNRALHRRYTLFYIIGIFALCLIANAAVVGFRTIYGTNEGTYAYNLLVYATWCFVIPYYSCIFIADAIFGKDYPNPMIKDKNTNGLSRTQLYLSNLIAAVLLAVVFVVIAFIFLLATTALFQIKDGMITGYEIRDFLKKMVIAVPLWIAGISMGNMFLFMFEKKRWAFVGYFTVTLVIPRLIMLFAAEPFKWAVFRFLRTYTITQNFSLIPYPADPARNVPLTIALGVIFTIISTVIGCVYYNKKKFK